MGAVDASLLAYPLDVVLAANYLYLLVLISFNKEKWKWTEHFTGRATYITSLTAMLVLTIIFGLVRQDGAGGAIGALGLSQMKNSWTFNIFLLHFTSVIGVKAIDDLRNIKRQKLHTAIMHTAFFIVLFAGIFGSGGKQKVHLTAIQGNPVNIGTAENGKKAELPFIIRLKDFSLEEYPPHIHIYADDNLSKEHIIIKEKGDSATLGKWHIECKEYLEMAGCKPGDSLYRSMNHVGATTAIYVRATAGNNTVEGWISCGSHIFPGSALPLPDGQMLAMPRREVKKYLSQVEVSTGDEIKNFDIAVNSPAAIGAWKIYQSGYDNARGRWSTTSTFECVKDSWQPATHTAMWLILAAGVFALFANRTKKKRK
ncbi:MAG: hypothetical protein IKY69_01650 [Bacteroidaceae bacterium]|nr:hypothetical protein [Bacteroidaceae bacterium]